MAIDALLSFASFPKEVAFLVNAADTKLLTFQPHKDPMIVGLIDWALLSPNPLLILSTFY